MSANPEGKAILEATCSPPLKWRAFLSYSRKDAGFATDLHRALETYTIPHGVPCGLPLDKNRRLYPIFRDQDELPASADLGGRIKDALDQSDALIVICSPAAASSLWVNEEIRYFLTLGRRDQIFCVIASGEIPACFPAALIGNSESNSFRLGVMQPAAVDMRSDIAGRDRRAGFRAEKLRLVAGLIKADPSDLLRRDKEQLARRRVKIGLGTLLLLLLTSAFLLWQRSHYEDRLRQEMIRELVSKGQRRLLADNPLRALPYLAEAYKEGEASRELRLLLAYAMAPLDSRKLTIHMPSSRIVGASFSPDGKQIVRIQKNGQVALLSGLSGKLLHAFQQPSGDFTAFAFSPDSRSLAVASVNIARIWDTASGNLRAILYGHEYDIKDLDFSPDGKLLVTASVDNTARLWDAKNGQQVRVLRGHSASVLSAGFSSDGGLILTVGNDRTARLWSVATGEQILRMDTQTALGSGRFSPDGKRILLFGNPISGRNFVGLYELDGHPVFAWNKKPVLGAEFAPDGIRVLVITSEDGRSLKVVALPEEDVLYSLLGDNELLAFAKFSEDRKRLITAGFDGTPKIWNLTTGRLEEVINISPRKDALSRAVTYIEFSRSGQDILLISGDNEVSVWKLRIRHRVLEGGKPGLFFLAYSHRTDLLLSADRTTVRIWNRRGDLLGRIEPPGGILHVVQDHLGRRVLTMSPDSGVYLWSVPEGRLLATMKGNSREVVSADFSLDDRYIVTAGSDGLVNLYSASGHKVRSLPRQKERLGSVQFALDGRRALVAAFDGSVNVWDLGTVQPACSLVPAGRGITTSAKYSPDGKFIVTGGDRPMIWDSTCRLVTELPKHVDAYISSFSPDSLRFTTVGFGEPLRIWGIDGKLHSTLQRSHILPSSTSFSPDGAWILVAGTDRAEIWDARTGRSIMTFGSGPLSVRAAFRPQGDELAIATSDGSIELWDLHPEPREPGTISRLVGEQCPWKLKDGLLYEAEKDAGTTSDL